MATLRRWLQAAAIVLVLLNVALVSGARASAQEMPPPKVCGYQVGGQAWCMVYYEPECLTAFECMSQT